MRSHAIRERDDDTPSSRRPRLDEEAPPSSSAPLSGRGWWLPGRSRSLSAPPPPITEVSTAHLRGELTRALDRSLRFCLATQDPCGSWQAAPDPRLFDTGLVAYALSHVEHPKAEEAVKRARAWLAPHVPQVHDFHARLLEETPRQLLLGEAPVVDLRTPTLYSNVYRRKALLLYVLGLLSGVKVLSPHKPSHVKEQVRQFYQRRDAIQMKQWSKVDLISIYALFEAMDGNVDELREVCAQLATMQGQDGSYCHNPVSTAMALLALTAGAPDAPAWKLCLQHLLDTQMPDGTWRFCSCDVWDTTVTLRAFWDHPIFAAEAGARALGFLLGSQNPDGGWGFRTNVESDNDTTSSALLALAGYEGAEVVHSIEKGITFLLGQQKKDGLWDTWQSSDDHPVEDCVAHITAAIAAYRGSHTHSIRAAQRWLEHQYELNGRWTAGWYRSLPYSTLEVSKGLRPGHPVAYAAVRSLKAIQNADGGFPLEPGEDSSASATGLAVAALAEHDDIHQPFLQRAINFLASTQHANGTWTGLPEMFGPRPLLTHFQTTTHAFASFGLMAAWRRLGGAGLKR